MRNFYYVTNRGEGISRDVNANSFDILPSKRQPREQKVFLNPLELLNCECESYVPYFTYWFQSVSLYNAEEERTMANQQQSVNYNSSNQAIHDNLGTRNFDEGRNDRLHMLLTTTYGLNNSHTKRIQVGLQSTKEGVFVPLIKLSGNNADGINFDVDSWLQFQDHTGLMSEYLRGDGKLKPNPVGIKNINISFTSAYGSRSILISYKETEEERSSEETVEDAADSLPVTKKRRHYSVAIVMQKTTFQGLLNVIKCVDAHLEHLKLLSESVNVCAQRLIQEIELKLPLSYVDCEIIKLTIKGNQENIERNVRTQINDLTFLGVYFNIIFLELITLRCNEITNIILSKRRA